MRDAVIALRSAGVDVEVVSPASFRHFGLAYGHGIVGNLRHRPWKVVVLPAFLASYSLAARRAARSADLVHAHWLPSALPALKTRKPFVLQLWGTDVELASRAEWLARTLVRRARIVVCPSEALAARARELDARDVRVVPSGVAIPDEVGEPADPPHVLFVGRLSEEKGILEFLAATDGIPRVIVGDGPLRDRVPDAVGFVPRHELGGYYERAAVVVCPSRREGYGVVAREAMAHGAPGDRDGRRRSPRCRRRRRDRPSCSPAGPRGAEVRDRAGFWATASSGVRSGRPGERQRENASP